MEVSKEKDDDNPSISSYTMDRFEADLWDKYIDDNSVIFVQEKIPAG